MAKSLTDTYMMNAINELRQRVDTLENRMGQCACRCHDSYPRFKFHVNESGVAVPCCKC